MSDYKKEKVEEFREKFTDSVGAAGTIWKPNIATEKQIKDIESFLQSSLQEMEKRHIVELAAMESNYMQKELVHKAELQEMEEKVREDLKKQMMKYTCDFNWDFEKDKPKHKSYIALDKVLSLLSHKKDTGEKCGCEADEWGIEHTISAHEGHLPKKEDK